MLTVGIGSVWDGPGRLIGVVGTVDLASVSNNWGFHTFDQPVTGLTPQSRYFVLINFSGANIKWTEHCSWMESMIM